MVRCKLIAVVATSTLLALAAARPLRAADAKPVPDVRQSVVQIYSTIRPPNVFEPWAKHSPQKISGTGVVLEGGRILTNAHVVAGASEITCEPFESGRKVAAKVEHLANGIDLAVLKLTDAAVIQKRPAIVRAKKLPAVRETVSCYGYPIGGSGLSITKGIISRIEYSDYSMGEMGLRMQVDAAINPGNSGGPAIVDDQMVGLAFAGLDNGENIGYLIPNEEIDLFLDDIKDGRYDGKRALFDDFQSLENDAIRAKLGMTPEMSGVLVTNVRPPRHNGERSGLATGDVVLKVESYSVENDGMVRLADDMRWSFAYLAGKSAKNGKTPMTVLRGGKEIQVDVSMLPEPDYLIKSLRENYPSYFVYGPFVLTTVSLEFVDGLRKKEETQEDLLVHKSPLVTRYNDETAFAGEELVAIAAILPHKLSEGYDDDFQTRVVSHIDGTPVKNLRHAVELLRDGKGKFVEFRMAEVSHSVAVFDRKAVAEAAEEILSDNGVRQAYSRDLADVWLKKTSSAPDKK